MAYLVLELQQAASSGAIPLPDVLRKARMVATKIKLMAVNSWIAHELHGYPSGTQLPTYRHLRGDVRARNPYNGLLVPVRVGNAESQDALSVCKIYQSIGSLYELTTGDSNYLNLPFSEQQMISLRRMFPDESDWLMPFRKLDYTRVAAIFDAVRNRILDWTLTLEEEGILGEGMTFTPQEKDKAAALPVINIGTVENFHGVIGSVTGSTLHIDNVHAVDSALESRGFSAVERAEIQRLVAEHKAAAEGGKLAAAKRGAQWVVEHAEKLGTLAGLFRNVFSS